MRLDVELGECWMLALTLELRGRDDLDGHDRLEDDRLSCVVDLAECTNGCQPERQLGRIDGVRETIVQDQAAAADRVPRKRPLLQCLVEPLWRTKDGQQRSRYRWKVGRIYLLASRDVAGRDVATHDLVDELDVLARLLVHLHRFDKPDNTCVLPSTTGLLLVRVEEVRTLGDRLAERDTRFAGRTLNVVFTFHTLDVDFQVELTHAGNNCLQPR